MQMTDHFNDIITLAHGGGGLLSQQLVDEIFVPAFSNVYLAPLGDSAMVRAGRETLAFTTDSFTVDPLFFPGGDIGRLAVCGTVNDLAVSGADPKFLSAGMIIEEGLPVSTLGRIVRSMKTAADQAGVSIVTGDTKVVEKGKGDGIFINTSGVGIVRGGLVYSTSNIAPGDRIIVNGPLGNHGMAVMTAREGFGFSSTIDSDVAPLNGLIRAMQKTGADIHMMRDATRGGAATVLNEIASAAGVTIEVDEPAVPVSEPVRGACELLGFDPLYVANEGVIVVFAAPGHAGSLVEEMRRHPFGTQSAVIGTVKDRSGGMVVLRTTIGSSRILDMLTGEMLPRIC